MSSGYHLFSRTTVAGRKPYRCIWCGEAISKGELHIFERSIYEGRFQNNRWHPECLDACDQEFRESGDDEYMPYSNDRPEPQVRCEG